MISSSSSSSSSSNSSSSRSSSSSSSIRIVVLRRRRGGGGAGPLGESDGSSAGRPSGVGRAATGVAPRRLHLVVLSIFLSCVFLLSKAFTHQSSNFHSGCSSSRPKYISHTTSISASSGNKQPQNAEFRTITS